MQRGLEIPCLMQLLHALCRSPHMCILSGKDAFVFQKLFGEASACTLSSTTYIYQHSNVVPKAMHQNTSSLAQELWIAP